MLTWDYACITHTLPMDVSYIVAIGFVGSWPVLGAGGEERNELLMDLLGQSPAQQIQTVPIREDTTISINLHTRHRVPPAFLEIIKSRFVRSFPDVSYPGDRVDDKL